MGALDHNFTDSHILASTAELIAVFKLCLEGWCYLLLLCVAVCLLELEHASEFPQYVSVLADELRKR